MQTPAVYDLQTEKLAFPTGRTVTIGREADVVTPISTPWGNRGGVGNIERLLEGVAPVHAMIEFDDRGARLRPEDETATVWVESAPVEGSGRRIRSGETVVLGREKSALWEGYRMQVFF